MKKSLNVLVWLSKIILAQQNSRSLQWLVKAAATTAQKECNKYDLIAPHCFFSDWPYHNDWSRWFAISSPPPILLLEFQFHD
jgi:hypothetical protein